MGWRRKPISRAIPFVITSYSIHYTKLYDSNHSGALLHLLQPFSDNNINLTRIESRPSRQNIWEYVFFIDLEGHVSDPEVVHAMQALSEHASLVKNLGSYPRAIA